MKNSNDTIGNRTRDITHVQNINMNVVVEDFLSLAFAFVLRFGTVPKLVENMSRVLEDHDRHFIGLRY